MTRRRFVSEDSDITSDEESGITTEEEREVITDDEHDRRFNGSTPISDDEESIMSENVPVPKNSLMMEFGNINHDNLTRQIANIDPNTALVFAAAIAATIFLLKTLTRSGGNTSGLDTAFQCVSVGQNLVKCIAPSGKTLKLVDQEKNSVLFKVEDDWNYDYAVTNSAGSGFIGRVVLYSIYAGIGAALYLFFNTPEGEEKARLLKTKLSELQREVSRSFKQFAEDRSGAENGSKSRGPRGSLRDQLGYSSSSDDDEAEGMMTEYDTDLD